MELKQDSKLIGIRNKRKNEGKEEKKVEDRKMNKLIERFLKEKIDDTKVRLSAPLGK